MRIYLDHASTTCVTEPVLEAMLPCLRENWGNASSLHSFGREAHRALEHAREQAAGLIGAESGEVFFTSGGTESDNQALRGICLKDGRMSGEIIVSAVEHPAVLNTARALEKQGFRVRCLMPDADGRVSPDRLEAMITPETVLVSVMTVNNETGSVQPIRELCEAAHARGVPFHTDAVQAAGAMEIDVKVSGVDLLSLSGHKFHAPKGIGILYVRRGVRPEPYLTGGHQERGMRAGTENVASAAGLGAAAEIASQGIRERAGVLEMLRGLIRERILASLPDTLVNEAPFRHPGILSMTFPGIDAGALNTLLDLEGIAVSNGPACSAGSPEPSHVLLAMGRTREQALSTLRFSVGEENTPEECRIAADAVIRLVRGLKGTGEGTK